MAYASNLERMGDSILQSWEYLETLPGTQFYRLYKSPSSALAIFRKRLSNLGKSFCDQRTRIVSDNPEAKLLVMTLLYLPRPMPVKQLELFVKEGSRRLVHFSTMLAIPTNCNQ